MKLEISVKENNKECYMLRPNQYNNVFYTHRTFDD